jgi:phosphoglycerate dehydrogenase-like enzyme
VRPIKIALAGSNPEQISLLRQTFSAASFTELDPDAPWEDSDAVIGFTRAAFDRVFVPAKLAKAPSVRWYHAPGAGIESYIFPGLADHRFALTNGKIIQGPEVADHAMALLLALTRRLHYVLRGVPTTAIPRPVELNGKTLVAIGAGGIGLLVAERAAAFGMRVIVVTEDNIPLVSYVSECHFADRLADIVPAADVVVMAAPATESSRRVMNDAVFAAMKPGAYFVNVSRGVTVDTDALWRAVSSQRLAGAGLDVVDPEPLPPSHPLLGHPNVIISDHLAGISDNLRARNFDLISTNIRRFIGGLPLINVVDKTRGY